jgi:hypothetical protein
LASNHTAEQLNDACRHHWIERRSQISLIKELSINRLYGIVSAHKLAGRAQCALQSYGKPNCCHRPFVISYESRKTLYEINAQHGSQNPVTSTHAGTQELVTPSSETVMQERAKHGFDQLIRQGMDAHKNPGSGAQTAQNAIKVLAEVREMSDQGISHISTNYVETEQLCHLFGGLEAFKTLADYEHVIETARERYSAMVVKKDRARVIISAYWGEHWEEDIDPQEFCLRQFSEHF